MTIYMLKLSLFCRLQSWLYVSLENIGIAVLGSHGLNKQSVSVILPLMCQISRNPEILECVKNCGLEMKPAQVLVIKQQVDRAIAKEWLSFLIYQNEGFASLATTIEKQLGRPDFALHLKDYYNSQDILLQAIAPLTKTLPTTKAQINSLAKQLNEAATKNIVKSLVAEHQSVYIKLKLFLNSCPRLNQPLEEFIHEFWLAVKRLHPLRKPLEPAAYEYRGVKNLIIKTSKEQVNNPKSIEVIKRSLRQEDGYLPVWVVNRKQFINHDNYSAYFPADEKAILDSFLKLLTPAERRVIETFYHHCEDLSQDKMAKMLNLKPTTFNKYLKTARDRLKIAYYSLEA